MHNLSSRVIFSSLFFFMAIFLFLSLIVSNVSETFAQLFLIFSAPFRAYYFVNNILLLAWAFMCFLFVKISRDKFLNNIIEQVIAGAIGVVVISVFIIRLILQILDNEIISYSSQGLLGIIADNIFLILFFLIIYVFFIFIPLLLGALKIHINIFDKLGKKLESFKPSLNVSIFMLFACAIQPYYDKNNVLLYVDLFLFYVCFVTFIVNLYRNKNNFGFYEYANLLWLFAGILIFIFSSHIISQTNYNIVRFIFIIIGLMGWCGDWMLVSLKQSKKLNPNKDVNIKLKLLEFLNLSSLKKIFNGKIFKFYNKS